MFAYRVSQPVDDISKLCVIYSFGALNSDLAGR